MAIPDTILKYYEKDLLDRAIDNALTQNAALTQSDFNKVAVAAQVQSGIDKYRAEAKNMDTSTLRLEVHSSALLGRHLEEVGYKRPLKCHAHAIVAGKHKLAASLRLNMARLKIRIDDADNGCWLPENTAATPHPAFPSAVPHSRIHREAYFLWISGSLGPVVQENLFRTKLQIITRQLQHGTLPKNVLNIGGFTQ